VDVDEADQDEPDDTSAPVTAAEPTETAPPSGAAPRRVWWITFGIYMLLGGMWAIGTPLFSVSDEGSHVVRAAAVARGNPFPGQSNPARGYTNFVEVPAIYAKGQFVAECYLNQADTTAGCEERFDGSTKTTIVETTAGTYQPGYYLPVGLPSLAFPNATGVYLMRLVSAALSAVFIASAMSSVWLIGPGRRLVAMAIGIAATPKTLFLMGSVNPNGLEAALGICLWATLAILLLQAAPDQQRRLLLRAAVAGAALAMVRPGSVMWVALILGFLAVWAGYKPVLSFVRERTTWLVGGAIAASCVVSMGWILHYGTLDQVPGVGPRGQGLRFNITEAFGRTTAYINNAVGVLGPLGYDHRYATIPIYTWYAMLGLIVILALACTDGWRQRLSLVGLGVAVLLLPAVFQLPRADLDGFPWQGRYILALFAGVPILAAIQIVRSNLLPDILVKRLSTILLLALVFAQAFCFIWALKRYDAGLDVLNVG
jgi:hypothetical protein